MEKDTKIKLSLFGIAGIPVIVAGVLAYKKAAQFKKLSEPEKEAIREQNKKEEEARELSKEEPIIAAGNAALATATTAANVIGHYDDIKGAIETNKDKVSKDVVIKTGVAIGVTFLAIGIGVGSYKLVKKYKAKKELKRAEEMLEELQEHLDKTEGE